MQAPAGPAASVSGELQQPEAESNGKTIESKLADRSRPLGPVFPKTGETGHRRTIGPGGSVETAPAIPAAIGALSPDPLDQVGKNKPVGRSDIQTLTVRTFHLSVSPSTPAARTLNTPDQHPFSGVGDSRLLGWQQSNLVRNFACLMLGQKQHYRH